MNYQSLYEQYKQKYMIEKIILNAGGGSDDFKSSDSLIGLSDNFTFYFLPIITLQQLLSHSQKNNHMDLLYMITKIVYSTDSIGEGWDYNKDHKLTRIKFNDMISKLSENFYESKSPSGVGGNYISSITLPIYRLLLLEFKNIQIKKIEKNNSVIGIDKLKKIFTDLEKKGHTKLLYRITKIIAENDSISEGWRYTQTYTKKYFNKEINMLRSDKIVGSYIGMAGLPIYDLIID
jgi:hypothetical protein